MIIKNPTLCDCICHVHTQVRISLFQSPPLINNESRGAPIRLCHVEFLCRDLKTSAGWRLCFPRGGRAATNTCSEGLAGVLATKHFCTFYGECGTVQELTVRSDARVSERLRTVAKHYMVPGIPQVGR